MTAERPAVATTDTGLRGLERELLRLPGVRAARIVADDRGQPIEVHIVSTTDHDPRSLVRDVQSIARSTFDIDIDHRIVSVARVDHRSRTSDRPLLLGIETAQRGPRWVAEVTIGYEGRHRTGTAAGARARSSRLHAAAVATLDGLRQLVPGLAIADVETPLVVSTDHRKVAMVTVVFGQRDTERAESGTAVVGDAGEVHAVVRAVLDAVNRQLPTLSRH